MRPSKQGPKITTNERVPTKASHNTNVKDTTNKNNGDDTENLGHESRNYENERTTHTARMITTKRKNTHDNDKMTKRTNGETAQRKRTRRTETIPIKTHVKNDEDTEHDEHTHRGRGNGNEALSDNKYERKTQRRNSRVRMTKTARCPRITIRNLFCGTGTYTHGCPLRKQDT